MNSTSRHSAIPLEMGGSGRSQHHAQKGTQLTHKFPAFFEIQIFTRSKHVTYPEPDQSSHKLTY
jgi:hypothetical protein